MAAAARRRFAPLPARRSDRPRHRLRRRPALPGLHHRRIPHALRPKTLPNRPPSRRHLRRPHLRKRRRDSKLLRANGQQAHRADCTGPKGRRECSPDRQVGVISSRIYAGGPKGRQGNSHGQIRSFRIWGNDFRMRVPCPRLGAGMLSNGHFNPTLVAQRQRISKCPTNRNPSAAGCKSVFGRCWSHCHALCIWLGQQINAARNQHAWRSPESPRLQAAMWRTIFKFDEMATWKRWLLPRRRMAAKLL